MDEDIFHVSLMEFPKYESRKKTLKTLNIADTFETKFSSSQMKVLLELESQDEELSMVVISEIHLDKIEVLKKLKRIFENFEKSNLFPIFVLIGNFSSKRFEYSKKCSLRIKTCFNALGDLIEKFPKLAENSEFVFIPGSNDLTKLDAKTFPIDCIPCSHLEGFKRKAKKVNLSTNPCRIRLYTQEVVVFREDLTTKFKKNLLFPPKISNEDGTMSFSDHMIKSVCDQCHLCPFPFNKKPIRYEFDSSLRLYPLPDVLILADQANFYQKKYKNELIVLNPGNFSLDSTFAIYWPATKEIELSNI